jgi:hypothetical protein
VETTQNSHTGYTAKLWKIVKENGVEVSRDNFNNSTYAASPKIITVGIKSDNADAVAAIKAAIASGNESTIRAAAAANSSASLKKKEEEEKKAEEAEEKKKEEEENKKEDTSSDDEKKSSENKTQSSTESKTEKESGKTTE